MDKFSMEGFGHIAAYLGRMSLAEAKAAAEVSEAAEIVKRMSSFGRRFDVPDASLSEGNGYSPMWLRLSSQCKMAHTPV